MQAPRWDDADEDDADDDDDDEENEDYEDDDDMMGANSCRDEDNLPLDIGELRELTLRLREKVQSLAQSARAKGKHKDFAHTTVSEKDKHGRVRSAEEMARLEEAAMLRRQERAAASILKDFKKYNLCRAAVVNRLGLKLTVAERKEMREMGFLSQEWFLAFRACAAKLQKLLYTAENSLEMRLSEHISIRAQRRMRRVLTEVKDAATGKWEWLVLAKPPLHSGRKVRGDDPSLKKSMNDALGIYQNRPVYAPSPIADDHAMRDASRKMLNGRKIDVAIPSKDGFSGASWSFRQVLSDLWHGVAGNLRPLRPPAAASADAGIGAIRRV